MTKVISDANYSSFLSKYHCLDQWDDAQKLVHSSSICARHGLIKFKILHRLHLSKEKLSKMFPSVDSTSDRCGQSGASLAHMFWKCPKIITYWSTIFQIMSDIIRRPLDPDPVLALFGVKDDNITISKSQYSVITFVMLLARRLILLNWKQKKKTDSFHLDKRGHAVSSVRKN